MAICPLKWAIRPSTSDALILVAGLDTSRRLQQNPTLVAYGDQPHVHESVIGALNQKDVMTRPGGIPSVGCLLYLAADQLVAHRPSMVPFSMTRVPCKRVWVHSVHLAAMVFTATFLSLQESGHLSVRIHEEPWPSIPSAMRTSLYTEVLDPTSRPGLPGELLSTAIQSRDGRVGTAQGSAGLDGTDVAQVLGLSVQHPYVRYAVRRELAQVNVYTKSWGVVRPDCARIALLEAACADAIRWWEQQQADAPRLCGLLFAYCRTAAATPPLGGGG